VPAFWRLAVCARAPVATMRSVINTNSPLHVPGHRPGRAKKARNEGIGGKLMKLVVVTQWVRASCARLKSHPTNA
jgi:hypothetical protein